MMSFWQKQFMEEKLWGKTWVEKKEKRKKEKSEQCLFRHYCHFAPKMFDEMWAMLSLFPIAPPYLLVSPNSLPTLSPYFLSSFMTNSRRKEKEYRKKIVLDFVVAK
jgi:hypothetical protein